MEKLDVLIVGGGHGGATAAAALRQRAFGGTIAIVSDDPELPYERPPLSKEYLGGLVPFEKTLLRPPTFWNERQVMLRLGERVAIVDPSSHRVTLASGEAIEYRHLIWAAGGKARRLACEGHHLRGIHTVRTRRDVDHLLLELAETRRIVIVGGGYIGLEAAAVLSKSGKSVVVLEALDRVLARVSGEPLSRFYEAEHRQHGVDVRLGVTVSCIEAQGDRVSGVRLNDGEVIPAEIVIVGIGIVPSVEPLSVAGADVSDGVEVDAHCRTSLLDVYAIGDCARHQNPFAGGARVRLESVQNANDQATVVAKALTGSDEPYQAVPTFWSNQYDLRLQTAGLSLGHDQMIVRGEPKGRAFTVAYLRAGQLIALDCVNTVKDYIQGRLLLAAKTPIFPAIDALTDPKVPLKSLLPGP